MHAVICLIECFFKDMYRMIINFSCEFTLSLPLPNVGQKTFAEINV